MITREFASELAARFARQRTISIIAGHVADYLMQVEPEALWETASTGASLVDQLEVGLRTRLPEYRLLELAKTALPYLSGLREEDFEVILNRVTDHLDGTRANIIEKYRSWCLGQLREAYRRIITMVERG
jgi:hypothetical protein